MVETKGMAAVTTEGRAAPMAVVTGGAALGAAACTIPSPPIGRRIGTPTGAPDGTSTDTNPTFTLTERQARRRCLLSGLGAGVGLSAGLGVGGPVARAAGLSDDPIQNGPAQARVPGLDAPPEPQPQRPVTVPPMAVHRLRNGVQVVTAPRHATPVATLRLMVLAGDGDDPPGRPGLAGLTALMLARGCRRGRRAVGALALARWAEALGSALTVHSDWHSLSVSMSVIAPRVPAAIRLLADVLRRPLLQGDDFERVRDEVLDHLRLVQADPSAVADRVLRRAYWGDAPFGTVLTVPAVSALTVGDVRWFHDRHVRPARVALVVAGDVAPERVAWLAEHALGDWSATGAALPVVWAGAARPVAAPLVLVDMPGSGQSTVALAAPFAGQRDADLRVGQVAEAVLGGGYSARLNQAVRIRRGLSYGTFSSTESFAGGGRLQVWAQTDHRTAAEVLDVMRAEIDRLRAEPPSPGELAARQAALVGGFVRQLQTTGGLVDLAAAQVVAGRPLAAVQRYVAEVQAVTPAAVQAFARRHWGADRWRAVVVGDLSAAGESWSAAAPPQAWRVPLSGLDLDRADLGRAKARDAARPAGG